MQDFLAETTRYLNVRGMSVRIKDQMRLDIGFRLQDLDRLVGVSTPGQRIDTGRPSVIGTEHFGQDTKRLQLGRRPIRVKGQN